MNGGLHFLLKSCVCQQQPELPIWKMYSENDSCPQSSSMLLALKNVYYINNSCTIRGKKNTPYKVKDEGLSHQTENAFSIHFRTAIIDY